MAETPEERLARLRREVEATWSPPASSPPAATQAARTAEPDPTPVPSAPPPVPSAPAPPWSEPDPHPVPAPPLAPPSYPAPGPSTRPARSVPLSSVPLSTAPASRPAATGPRDGEDGWSVGDALGGAGFGVWIAIGLVVVGAYLLIALVVPGIELPGSLAMAAGGVVILWFHFTHRLGSWALYAGAVLFAIGTLRVIGDLLPVNVNGETALGLGLALLAIGYLRHQQAGGWGWQGIAGAVALGWGLIQFVLGLLPGSPGLLDLVLPVALLGGGVLLLARAGRSSR